MSDIYVMVGQRIRFYRKLNNLTQDQLGELTDIDQSYLGRIERGEVNITLETLNKFALALQIEPEKLLHISAKKESDEDQLLFNINSILLSLSELELKQIYLIIEQIIHYKNI